MGDVSQGEVLSIKNYYELMRGKLTPVQMEGLRLLLTPFPQQQFNQTEDRKVLAPSLGGTCFDCHVNGHTNAAFHLDPDTRPQAARSRLDTPSLRGMFNQQIHGSTRSLRSIEDFTEFEQRTAYFDGDHVLAAKKGVHLPDRAEHIRATLPMTAAWLLLFSLPLLWLTPDTPRSGKPLGRAVREYRHIVRFLVARLFYVEGLTISLVGLMVPGTALLLVQSTLWFWVFAMVLGVVSRILFGSLLGFLGFVLAVPLMAVILQSVKMIYV